ncbi:MAG: gliding motility protein [Spirosoma sp.]|nr:gliding motility protein [Spirosoma sp.]
MKYNWFIVNASRVMMIATVILLVQGCGFVKSKFGGKGGKGSDVGITNGEITATARKGFKQTTPYGMVLVPSGSFIMGQADEDVAATQINMNRQVTISSFYMDDAEISNHEYRQYVNALLADSVSVLGEEEIMANFYPDTTVWKNDFTFHNGDPMLENYYSHPAFDTYPVVGVSWRAAQHFSQWRSNMYNDYRQKEGQLNSPRFRLPSEAEWEWAARGGKQGAKYPWGNPYVANGKGCYLANFKPQRGNFDADGYPYTAPATAYSPNDYGLYNMSGNVAEWCRDAYADNTNAIVWDMNPDNQNADEPRKVVRGGSWKDIAYYLETGTRSYEYEDQKRSFIGFRCVMDNLEGRTASARGGRVGGSSKSKSSKKSASTKTTKA